ncbi:MAG: hypothetical protein KFW21_01695 [Spirochaetota bacterium]|nr:hypothetical protein [Spirochaetota bacterium]
MKNNLFILLTIVLAGCAVVHNIDKKGQESNDGSSSELNPVEKEEAILIASNNKKAQEVLDKLMSQIKVVNGRKQMVVPYFQRSGNTISIYLHNSTSKMDNFTYDLYTLNIFDKVLPKPKITFFADKVKLDFGLLPDNRFFNKPGDEFVFYVGEDVTVANPNNFLGYRVDLDGATIVISNDGKNILSITGGTSLPLTWVVL